MPEFMLNTPLRGGHAFYTLDAFAQAYVEAMFFTNGDCGDERGDIFNELGVERLTKPSIEAIRADCAAFEEKAADLLDAAYYAEDCDYDREKAGRDFWYTRQGHGVGYWDRGLPDDIGSGLTDLAHHQGEVNPYHNRGWIHYPG